MSTWQEDVIDDLTDGASYTVTRPAAGSYDQHGVWAAGAASTFSMVASVQPAGDSGRGRYKLPLREGVRIEDIREIATVTELRVGDSLQLTTAGVTEAFEVYSVQRFEIEGDANYLAMAAKAVAS